MQSGIMDIMEAGMGGSLPRFFYTIDEINRIENSPGLYSVLCYCGGEQSLIDVGQSDNLGSAGTMVVEIIGIRNAPALF